jgi:hypothetical protein
VRARQPMKVVCFHLVRTEAHVLSRAGRNSLTPDIVSEKLCGLQNVRSGRESLHPTTRVFLVLLFCSWGLSLCTNSLVLQSQKIFIRCFEIDTKPPVPCP